MNIILKGFDDHMCKPLSEGMTAGLPLKLCISIMDYPDRLPHLPENVEHIVMPARPLRAGQYPGTDWSTITPLDEELIEAMANTEVMFHTMIERYAVYGDIPYDERKRQYYRHLRYWNHLLTEKKIDLLVIRGAPHQCFDLVLYDLCKLKGIRTLSTSPYFLLNAFSVETDWKDDGSQLEKRMQELRQIYRDPSVPIELSPEFEASFERYTRDKKDQWYMKEWYKQPQSPQIPLARRSFVSRWAGTAMHLLVHKPRYLFSSIVSQQFWRRKLAQHRVVRLYDRLAQEPDFSVPYVYVPLHMQPEVTTCPMGGAYVDQELIVQMLGACLPKGVRMYVKEHPTQSERWRSEAFYKALHDVPSVTIVPRECSTFTLIEHAQAIASVTGTAMFEGIFKGKPAMMFGHKYFQFAPGVHRVRSLADCKCAVEEIFVHKKKPTLRELRMFLKAVEDTTGLSYAWERSVRPPEAMEERAKKMGQYIQQAIVAACA